MKNNLFKHLKLVRTHRKYVRQFCFKMHIPMQGVVHDLSKYSISELKIAKYYTGTRSPHEVCRELTGYSESWLHHKHHNKHHWQFWMDDMADGGFKAIKMPYKYVIEMFCDQVGASKAYLKERFTCESPWEYWIAKCKGKRMMYSESEYLLEKLIWNLKERGFDKFFEWYNSARNYLEENYNNDTLSKETSMQYI